MMLYGTRENMEGIWERYERSLRKKADVSEESGGEGNGDSKGDNDSKINILVRREEED